MDDRLLTTEALCELLPLERTTIWRLWKQGKFPKPFRIGRRTFWLRADIERWIDSRTFSSTHEAREFLKGGKDDSPTSLVS